MQFYDMIDWRVCSQLQLAYLDNDFLFFKIIIEPNQIMNFIFIFENSITKSKQRDIIKYSMYTYIVNETEKSMENS